MLINTLLALFIGFTAPTELETGDLIFLDLDCGEICDAIETVTLQQFKVDGPRLSHVGIIRRRGPAIFVVEAWPKGGVIESPLRTVIARTNGQQEKPGGYWIRRLPEDQRLGAEARLQKISTFMGRAYDDYFSLGEDSFYCSELVLRIWPEIFKAQPMFFGATLSKELRVWSEYYATHYTSAPSGALGLSPLGIYLELQPFN